MMTALRIRSVDRRPSELPFALRTSAYELVASWLLASVLVAGSLAFCLFVIWLSMGMFPLIKAVPVDLVQVQPSGGATSRKTRFGIRPIGKGYEFFVIDQQP